MAFVKLIVRVRVYMFALFVFLTLLIEYFSSYKKERNLFKNRQVCPLELMLGIGILSLTSIPYHFVPKAKNSQFIKTNNL